MLYARGLVCLLLTWPQMLCFITTNADLSEKVLQDCLKNAVDDSFNMISVDGDMSTNDTVLLLVAGR